MIMSLDRLTERFEQHDTEDKARFEKVFEAVKAVDKNVAVLNERQDRQDKDNKTIIEKIDNLSTSINNGNIKAAEAKGYFESFKIPIMGVISALITGGIMLIFKH